MAHILEVYRNILKAKIPEKWKKILIDEYNVNHKMYYFMLLKIGTRDMKNDGSKVFMNIIDSSIM